MERIATKRVLNCIKGGEDSETAHDILTKAGISFETQFVTTGGEVSSKLPFLITEGKHGAFVWEGLEDITWYVQNFPMSELGPPIHFLSLNVDETLN